LCEAAAAERDSHVPSPVVHSARACSTGSFEEAAHYAALAASPAPVEHPTGTVDPYALQPRRLGGLREPLPSPALARVVHVVVRQVQKEWHLGGAHILPRPFTVTVTVAVTISVAVTVGVTAALLILRLAAAPWPCYM